MTPRAWPWFSLYFLNSVVPQTGAPTDWAVLGQGDTGTVYVYPPPDQAYTLNLEVIARPIDLVDDTTADAIPFPFTDSVPYFAAYLALLSAQAGTRQNDARRMFELYQEFKNRARSMSTPSVVPHSYAQAPDLTLAGKLGQTGGVG